jgi:hypothetical protein
VAQEPYQREQPGKSYEYFLEGARNDQTSCPLLDLDTVGNAGSMKSSQKMYPAEYQHLQTHLTSLRSPAFMSVINVFAERTFRILVS